MIDHSVATGLFIGSDRIKTKGPVIPARCCIDGSTITTLASAGPNDVDSAVRAAHQAFLAWRLVPAQVRGEFVRRIGNELRRRKAELAELVTLEAGKITSEALGEVQAFALVFSACSRENESLQKRNPVSACF